MIILSLTELLYLLATHAGSVTHEGYANAPGHRAVKNPNYGNPIAYQPPRSVRFGMRVAF